MQVENQDNLAVLKVEHLGVRRGQRMLFENLSFVAKPGDLIWITGTNGSGKTSLLKCIAGLLQTDAGTVSGSSDQTDIAYLGHLDGHKKSLTAAENLGFWHDVYKSHLDLKEIMRRTDIWDIKDLPAKSLSAGQSRRVALARVLLKNARLWLFDEPAAPMDLDGKKIITNMIEAHIANGGIALIATHTTPFKVGSNAYVLRLGGPIDG